MSGDHGQLYRLRFGAVAPTEEDSAILWIDTSTTPPTPRAYDDASWATLGATNPLTTQDDLLVGGVGGAQVRLGKGSDGQVLRVNPTTHHLEWYTPVSGGGGGFGAPGYQGLTDGATIAWDLANGSGSVTLGGNRAMAAPTNLAYGETYFLLVAQDATGSRTLTWDSAYWWPNGTPPTLSTGANRVDLITFVCDGAHLIMDNYQLNVGPFVPITMDTYANLVAWFDAAQIAGKANGDSVTTWSDSKGSYHASTALGSGNMTYQTAVQNGKPVVRDNRTAGLGLTGSVGGVFATSGTLVLVIRNPSNQASGGNNNTSLGDFGTDGDPYFQFWGGGGYWTFLRNSRLANHPQGAEYDFTPNQPRIITIRSSGANGWRMRVNGADKYSTTASWGFPANPNIGGANRMQGSTDFCEIGLYTRDLGDSEVAALEAALNTKWGVF